MEHILRALDGMPKRPRSSGSRVTLAIVVRLSMRRVRACKFPVHLIQVVRLKHDAAYDSLARGGFEPDLELTEEDVELGLNGRRITFIVDCVLGAVVAVDDGAGGGVPG